MANNNYYRPLLEVHQELEVTQRSTGDHLAACIIGASYNLYRYGKEDLVPTAFNAAGQLIPFEFEQTITNNYEVDLASVEVHAENLEAKLFEYSTGSVFLDKNNATILRLANSKYWAATDSALLDPLMQGAPVAVGDVVYANDGSTTRRAVVKELIGAIIPATIAAGNVVQSAPGMHPIGVSPSTDGAEGESIRYNVASAYTGTKDTTYVLQCTKAPAADAILNAEFKVTDTSGIDVARIITVNTESTFIPIGTKGLQLQFSGSMGMNVKVGDSFSVICTAAKVSADKFDGVRLSAIPVNIAAFNRNTSLTSVSFHKAYTGELARDGEVDAAWSVTEAGVQIAPTLSIYIPDRVGDLFVPFDTAKGNIFVSYRVQVQPEADEEIYGIDTVEDIQAAFGTIDAANELAFACSRALIGSGGRRVYALRVTTNDVAGYLAAVKKTEYNTATYSFVPVTTDPAIQNAVVDFNNEMCLPTVKRWRGTFLGVNSPGEYLANSVDADGQPIVATITADGSGKNVLLQVPDTANVNIDFNELFINGWTAPLRVGDKVELKSSGVKFTVAAVLSATELILKDGPVTAITVPTPIALWKANTPDNTCEYITNLAESLADRRAAVCWCDSGVHVNGEGIIRPIDNVFQAAELAGITSAVLPHRSLTRIEVTTINRAVRMYTQYTQAQLDKIASHGVLIVTQDNKNAPCYVRHQLTTDSDKGPMFAELSVTRNLDNISFAVVDILEPFIGRANVTPKALGKLYSLLSAKLYEFTNTIEDELLGPALIAWSDLTVIQDPVFKDRVIVRVKYHLPLPMNNIRVYEQAYIAQVTL